MDEIRALTGVVVDSGHGGLDPGSSGNGIIEKTYNLLISQYIYNRLKELNVPVKMTKETDETLTPEERTARVKNAFGADANVVLLSNHLNAGGGNGAEVIYALRNNDTLSQDILSELGKEGQTIRRAYQRRLPSDPSKDYYFMQRETNPVESVTIEYGFVDNVADANRIKNNWENYAEAVVRAFTKYKNIPYTPPGKEGDTYVVKKGDTLYSIANRYNMTVDELKRLNNLTSDVLSVGQVLQVSKTGVGTHTVVRGDTLYSLANRYNTTVGELKRLNNLTSDVLSVGQVLKIPEEISDVIVHTVVRGDTLYSLASKYNTTIDTIKRLNNLTSDFLSIGQELQIPTDNREIEVSGDKYTVVQGDTLWNIAKRFGMTVDDIKERNNLDSNAISIDQKLSI